MMDGVTSSQSPASGDTQNFSTSAQTGYHTTSKPFTATLNADVDGKSRCPYNNMFCSFEELEQNARMGCPECTLRYHMILRCFGEQEISQETSTKLVFSHHEPFQEVRVGEDTMEFIITEKLSIDFLDVLMFYGNEYTVPCWRPSFSGNTSSPETISKVLDWLTQCDQRHTWCTYHDSKLPQRVLDVRNSQVHIRETMLETGRYACLSHRWGSSDMLRTTADNLREFKKSIPWELIPKTFQDAIVFLRNLGLSFIWIDSLCIVQDDPRDWQEQSSTMAKIYANSYITLAAAIAENSAMGCYTSDSKGILKAKQSLAKLRTVDGIEIDVFGRRQPKRSYKNFPYSTRAWVHQERYLSPRVLYFVDKEVVWQCFGFLECECGHERFDPDESFPSRVPFDLLQHNYTMLPGELNKFWHDIVRMYSTLQPTFPSDALPALSGLVQAYKPLVNDDYVASFWKKSLMQDLLWFRMRPSAQDLSLSQWRAPSWSWLSTDFEGAINFCPATQNLAVLEEVVATPSGRDPYGELDSALLQIRAKYVPATLQPMDEPGQFYIQTKGTAFFGPKQDENLVDVVCDKYLAQSCVFGFHHHRIEPGQDYREVVIIQMSRWTGEQPLTPTHYPESEIHINQQARVYLVLIKDEQDCQQWKRAGLISVVGYKKPRSGAVCDLDRGLYSIRNEDDVDGGWMDMSRDDLAASFEASAERSRGIYRAFDESPMQEFTIY